MKLRGKFLTLLVVLPSLCLGLFLYIAYSVFVEDKQASILEAHFELLNSANLLLTSIGPEQLQAKLEDLKKQEGFESLLIVDPAGRIFNDPSQSLENLLGPAIYQKLTSQASSEGGFENKNSNNERTLVSYLKLSSEPPLTLILTTPSQSASRASIIFLLKALCTFVALIALAVVVSLLFSNQLTKGLTHLSEVMLRFGQGELDVPVPEPDGQDEVASMTRSFRQMRSQIKNLMVERESKIRLEAEVQLAGQLQSRFFPPRHFQKNYQNKQVQFYGFFEPAQMAGGDWWFYFETPGYFHFMIGDVTGHGLNSAMMTGVARAAMSLIAAEYLNPAEALKKLNQVFFESSLGEINMTCFMGSLNLATGNLQYSSASHEVPYILPVKNTDLNKKDFKVLDCEQGSRLGEKKLSTYPLSETQLLAGEILFVYSDGLLDLLNSAGATFGERNTLKILGQNHLSNITSIDLINKVESKVAEYRKGTELNDDLSFFAIQWKGLT